MVRINPKSGYLERRSCKKIESRTIYRDWWLVKHTGGAASVGLKNLSLPKEYIGKRIRIKCEVETL